MEVLSGIGHDEKEGELFALCMGSHQVIGECAGAACDGRIQGAQPPEDAAQRLEPFFMGRYEPGLAGIEEGDPWMITMHHAGPEEYLGARKREGTVYVFGRWLPIRLRL
jgi:hypothetical protein